MVGAEGMVGKGVYGWWGLRDGYRVVGARG